MVRYEAVSVSILKSTDDICSCRRVVAVEVDRVCLDHGGSAGRFVHCWAWVGINGMSTVWIWTFSRESRQTHGVLVG